MIEEKPKEAAAGAGAGSAKGSQTRKRAEPADSEPYVEEIPTEEGDNAGLDDGGAAARLAGSMWSWIKSMAAGRLGGGHGDSVSHAAAQEKYQVRAVHCLCYLAMPSRLSLRAFYPSTNVFYRACHVRNLVPLLYKPVSRNRQHFDNAVTSH